MEAIEEFSNHRILLDLSLELQLLLELVHVDIDIDYLNKFKDKNINWGKFLQLAKHHRLIPILYYNISRNNLLWLPEKVKGSLFEKYNQNVFSMLHLTSEMNEIGQLFNKNNIQALFLKGPIIGEELYGDISLRTSKDLDILISKKDLKQTKELLIKFGYIEKPESPSILNEDKLRTHHSVFYKPNSPFTFEIHWRLNDLPDKEPGFKDLWNRRRVSNFSGESIYFLSEEDLFLYLVSHGARHGWFRLRWLVDIDRLLHSNTRWNKDKRVIKQYSNEVLIGQAIILVSKLLRRPFKEEYDHLINRQVIILSEIAITIIREIEYDQPFPEKLYPLYRSYNWKLQKNIVQKFKVVTIKAYPSFIDYQVLKLPKIFHFLYFPLRPFFIIGRRLGILRVEIKER